MTRRKATSGLLWNFDARVGSNPTAPHDNVFYVKLNRLSGASLLESFIIVSVPSRP